MAQACDYINESRNDKAKVFDQHPIIMLETQDALDANVASQVVTEEDLDRLFDPLQPAKYEYCVAVERYWRQCHPGREPRVLHYAPVERAAVPGAVRGRQRAVEARAQRLGQWAAQLF